MKCVRSVTYIYKIYGIPSPKLVPQRGLRQGNLLSPYLFILAMEALSYMLKKAESQGKISGIRFTPRPPSISPFFFADDIILFAKLR